MSDIFGLIVSPEFSEVNYVQRSCKCFTYLQISHVAESILVRLVNVSREVRVVQQLAPRSQGKA